MKLYLFANDMILFIKDPRDSTKKILDLINTFGKVSGYKINIKKISSFSIYQNEQDEKEIRKTIPLTIASKKKNTPRNKLFWGGLKSGPTPGDTPPAFFL
jgi:hypothetical protein